jgi:hypothetical protein
MLEDDDEATKPTSCLACWAPPAAGTKLACRTPGNNAGNISGAQASHVTPRATRRRS